MKRTWSKPIRCLGVVALLGIIGVGIWLIYRHYRAEHHLGQAAQALEKQRYRAALAQYRQALDLRPDSAPIHLLCGRTARRAGDIHAAVHHLRRCRALQGGVTEELQVEELLLRAQTGELAEVHSLLVPYLIQEGPLTPLVLESLARAYMGVYDADRAWQSLNRWLELEPNNAEALFRRGTWHAQQQNLAPARADYQRVLELDPARVEVRLMLAEVLKGDRHLLPQVEEQYRLYLHQVPGDAKAMLGLARSCVETGNLEEASRLLAALPQDQQTSADGLFLRGMVAKHQRRLAEAADLLRQALERHPGHLDACYNLMLCLAPLGKEDEARAVSARFHQIEQDEKRLIQITTKEIKAAQPTPELHCELGEIYLRLGLPERGVHWLNSALRLDPRLRRAHQSLKKHYEGLGPAGQDKADHHARLLGESR